MTYFSPVSSDALRWGQRDSPAAPGRHNRQRLHRRRDGSDLREATQKTGTGQRSTKTPGRNRLVLSARGSGPHVTSLPVLCAREPSPPSHPLSSSLLPKESLSA